MTSRSKPKSSRTKVREHRQRLRLQDDEDLLRLNRAILVFLGLAAGSRTKRKV